MADKIVLANTSILIDYFRKTDKSKSTLVKLFDEGNDFCISAITEYEIYSGTTELQTAFWKEMLKMTMVIAFDQSIVTVAVKINKALKLKSKQIAIADLFIASTAVANNLPLATLNKKHFERVDELQLL